ncbi:hypothetical protein BV61_03300 [Candidatus Synechococcus spongiarum LMB bulk15M]|uniref:HNH nuclease domain-containing protein n=1 Tax=Candidatus Synechococcus spongiarum LMB bulk15M TaxID=1943582 RepID=A0A1T1D053_9SYNE|nr:hypothetical protein BV61_03300 [Candidatus Synechococcus spongiarum LMB bulk15M]
MEQHSTKPAKKDKANDGTPNWSNQTIWTGDNLGIMRGMNSASVDLIYLDPPFNSNANYAAPIGSQAAGAEFKDTWTLQELDITWLDLIEAKHPPLSRVIHASMKDSDKSYLIYMAVRLLEIHRLLKPAGSIYLHCDPTMSHYLKIMMDAIFGQRKFKNEVIWSYRTGGVSKRYFARKHDVLLFYAADEATFNMQTEKAYTKAKNRKPGLVNYGAGGAMFYEDEDGVYNLVAMRDVWEVPYVNSQAKERTGYPTQKPLRLLQRIIRASSNEGDMVLDPFCGCATACIAAQTENRQWAGIDISSKATELVQQRMHNELDLFFQGSIRTDIPSRTDLGKLPRYNCLKNRELLYGQQKGYCGGCATHFEFRNLEVDHIISPKKGGTDHISNLQLLCGNCNRVKGDRGMEYLRTKLQLGKLRHL